MLDIPHNTGLEYHTMIQAIEPLNVLPEIKIDLEPVRVAYLLNLGYTQSQIAKLHKVSRSAVSQCISNHKDAIAPLMATDKYIALKNLHVANLAQDRLIEVLPEADKKNIIGLNAVSGTHTDKYRLFSNQSTENVSMTSLDTSLADLKKREQEIMTKLKTSTGVTEDIIDV